LKITIACLTAAALALLWPGQCLPEGAPSRSAFPSPLPTDITFEKVIAEYPYPGIRFPVPIIGWKHHPQEIHVTPSGALVLPSPRTPAALYLAPLIALDGGEPSLFDAGGVTQSLVDGFKPGIYSYWKTGGVKVVQAAFGSLLEGREVLTGNEPKAPVRGELLLNFTEGPRGIRAAGIGPAYPRRLAFSRGMVAEEDGSASRPPPRRTSPSACSI